MYHLLMNPEITVDNQLFDDRYLETDMPKLQVLYKRTLRSIKQKMVDELNREAILKRERIKVKMLKNYMKNVE